MQLHNLLTKEAGGKTNQHLSIIKSNSAAMATSAATAALTRKSKSKPQAVDLGGENLVKEI